MEDNMRRVFEHMRGIQIIQTNLSEEEFQKCLFGNSAERLDILQWMVSELHEQYKLDLQKSNTLKIDLCKILADLQFVSSSNKTAFVEGTLALKEQEKVMRNLLRGLSSVLFPCKIEKEFDVTDTIDYQMKKKPKNPKEQKLSKPFDFKKAWKNIEEAKSLLTNINENLETQSTENHIKFLPPLSNETVSGVLAGSLEFVEKFKNSKPAVRTPTTPIRTNLENLEACDGTLESAVSNLHSTLSDILKTNKALNQIGCELSTTIDYRKNLEIIEEFKKNSHIMKLNKYASKN